jgi:serine/threonine protein kinase
MRRRFRREAILGSRLDHRNIVRVFDFAAGDLTYLVMEHVPGMRLGEVIEQQGPMAVDTAAEVVLQLLAGLDEVHRHGIVHGDVKSDNVLLETLRDGTPHVRLFDFGLARFLRERATVFDQVVSGTPEYLAPEVIRGAPPTMAADIYGCGVILYELITGDTPFAGGSSTEILARQLEAPIVPLSWRCPDLGIPPALDDLVHRTLAKDPNERFASCNELAIALAEARRDVPARGATGEQRRSFSSDAPTCDMDPEISEDPVAEAIVEADVDRVVVAYLDRARALVEKHRLATAISELEEAAMLVGDASPAWRIQLTLAALYEGVGNREAARRAAVEARERAASSGSQIGAARASRFLVQLARRMTRPACYRDAL